MQNTKTFTMGGKKFHLLFLTTVGSKLHKLNLSNSDTDLKGVFLWDKSCLFGFDALPNTLDVNKCNKDDWKSLMHQLNEEFNLQLEDDDDLALFDAKKFVLTSLKNDFNMFDMLFSNEKHVFLDKRFSTFLENRDLFLDTKKAEHCFLGMAKGSLHEARKLSRNKERTPKEDNDLNKKLAKSLQFVFSFENFLLNGTHNPVLEDEQLNEVLEVKKGNSDFNKVAQRQSELFERLENNKDHRVVLEQPNALEELEKMVVELSLQVLNSGV